MDHALGANLIVIGAARAGASAPWRATIYPGGICRCTGWSCPRRISPPRCGCVRPWRMSSAVLAPR